MERSLIVARIVPAAQDRVAEIFAASDRTELPTLAGVRRRELYRLHDIYVHLLETEHSGRESIESIRGHHEFIRVSDQLSPYISPYLSTWRAPADAVARRIYRWDAPVTSAGERR